MAGGDLIYYLSSKRAVSILHVSTPTAGKFVVSVLPGAGSVPDTTDAQWAQLVREVAAIELRSDFR
eukprot:5662357-Lingulodinium_polyedra.AAC.1